MKYTFCSIHLELKCIQNVHIFVHFCILHELPEWALGSIHLYTFCLVSVLPTRTLWCIHFVYFCIGLVLVMYTFLYILKDCYWSVMYSSCIYNTEHTTCVSASAHTFSLIISMQLHQGAWTLFLRCWGCSICPFLYNCCFPLLFKTIFILLCIDKCKVSYTCIHPSLNPNQALLENFIFLFQL